MSSGTRVIGKVAVHPEQSGSYFRRVWNGGNDKDHAQPQNYEGSMIRHSHTCAAVGNALNPTYTAVGLPDHSVVQTFVGYLHGETSNKALGAMHDAIRGHNFSAVNSLAELDETLALLANALKNAYAALRDLSKFDIPSFARRIPKLTSGSPARDTRALKKSAATGDISATWLAAQYGWLPIVSGVQDALDALEEQLNPLQAYRFIGKAKSEKILVRLDPGVSPPTYGWLRNTVTYRAAVNEQPNQWRLAGFSWEYLPGVLWERVPFSFVCDYFLPIGGMLSAWADTRITDLYMKYVVRTSYNIIVPYKVNGYYYYAQPDSRNIRPGSCKFVAITLKRTVNPIYLAVLPSLQGFDRIKRGERVENTVALVHQLYTGGRRDVARWRPF